MPSLSNTERLTFRNFPPTSIEVMAARTRCCPNPVTVPYRYVPFGSLTSCIVTSSRSLKRSLVPSCALVVLSIMARMSGASAFSAMPDTVLNLSALVSRDFSTSKGRFLSRSAALALAMESARCFFSLSSVSGCPIPNPASMAFCLS